MKRGILYLCTILGAALVASASARPNFIFILVDDMGYGDLSCYGNTAARTKNIDRLATEGIRFNQFYVSSPICSPSRTGLTTGQYPARWRVTSYLAARQENDRRGTVQWLDAKAPTLARLLQSAGYATGHFGKWHMGGQRDVGEAPLISEYGFDESLTQFEGLGDRILPLLDAYDGQEPKKYDLGSASLGRGNITWLDRSKVTGAFVSRTIEFVKKSESAGKPFFVNLWPDDVHSPFFPPKDLRTNNVKRDLYHAVLTAMDAQMAPLFDYVRSRPALRDNTLIMLAGDNGPEPGAGSAGPFRGSKGQLLEGGIRNAFIAWGPGLIPANRAGSVNEKTVISSVDIAPSLLKLAGVTPHADVPFDGVDLGQSLTGKAQEIRSKPLLWNRPPDRPGTKEDPWPDLAIRDGDWKLLIMEDGAGARLFNVAIDPGEGSDLSAKNPEITRRLSQEVLNWRKALPISKPLPVAPEPAAPKKRKKAKAP